MELTEELAFMKERIMKRRMEEGAKGGEVRRLHIIYFLSRMGRIEHPHLIRVHQLNRNGVRLRDAKRWLSELRGKDMPESFAWSYKRFVHVPNILVVTRYKRGYVWQDLLDDDLITPISDNEYVLKGSQISATTPSSSFDPSSYGDKKSSAPKQQQPLEVDQEAIQAHPDSKIDIIPTKTSSSSELIDEESPPFGSEASTTLTDDSMKLEEEKHSDATAKQESHKQLMSEEFENSSPFYSNLWNKKKNMMEKTASSSPSPSFTKSKSYSRGSASHVFRNLITCGAVDTNDSAMVMINRTDKTKSSTKSTLQKQDGIGKAEIIRGEKLGGSARIFGTSSWNQQQQQQQQYSAQKSCDGVKGSKKKNNKSSEFSNQKPVSAAFKPFAGPNCSQCGKSFKPEKMHSHMKSCRGMKALAKSAAASVEKTPSQSSMNSSYRESVPGYFLTH